VLDGDPAHPPQTGAEPSPQFSAHVHCGQTTGCIKMPLAIEVGLSPGDFVLDGEPSPLHKKGRSHPNFRPMVIVAKRLDGSRWLLVAPSKTQVFPSQKGAEPSPIFGPCLLWPNGWMDQDGTWNGGGSWSRSSSLPVIFGPFLLCLDGWMDQDAT